MHFKSRSNFVFLHTLKNPFERIQLHDDCPGSNLCNVQGWYYTNGIRRIPKESLIPCLKTYAKATGWEQKLDTILQGYMSDELQQNDDSFVIRSILELSMFNVKEANSISSIQCSNVQDCMQLLMNNGEDCSTIHFIRSVLKTTKLCLNDCYRRNEKLVKKTITTLDGIINVGTHFTETHDRYESNIELGWRVGTLFQQELCYITKEGREKVFCCGLNQPDINGRKIDVGELYNIIREVESNGTKGFEFSIGVCAPYEFTNVNFSDSDGNQKYSTIEPMLHTLLGMESKCYAKPLSFESLDDLFWVLTNHRINQDTFPLFFSIIPNPIQMLHFGLNAVLECIRNVYGNLKTVQNYHELFLVLHLFQTKTKEINLVDYARKDQEALTFPIGYKELVSQTVYKFQATTPVRFGWIEGQKRQSAVTTFTCGESFFFNNNKFEKLIQSFDSRLFGKPLIEYCKRKFDLIQGSYPSTFVFVKEDNQKKNSQVTLCPKVAIPRLKKMSIKYQNISTKGHKTTYVNALVQIATMHPELLWPIPGNKNWVDHFFYKRWDCVGYVWEESPHDMTVEFKQTKKTLEGSKPVPIPKKGGMEDTPKMQEQNNVDHSPGVCWEVDYALEIQEPKDIMSCKRLFQYTFLGRPNLVPRKNFLKDQDIALDEQMRQDEKGRSQTILVRPLQATAYVFQKRDVPAYKPIKYFGHPSRSPYPRCAWCVIGFLTEFASGTPNTINLAIKFLANNGERDRAQYEFHHMASNHAGSGHHDVLVYNHCVKNSWSSQVRKNIARLQDCSYQFRL